MSGSGPESQKARRERHIAAGLCSICDDKPVPGRRCCEKHLSAARASAKRYFAKAKARRRAAGLCLFCDRKQWRGRKTCRKHALSMRVASLRHYHAHRERINKDPRRLKRIADWHSRKLRTSPRYRFVSARAHARHRGLAWSLSQKTYSALIAKPCEYCELPNNVEVSTGLDRLDNSKGYVPGNVVSCCRECNIVRGDRFSPDEMRVIGAAVREVKLCRKAIGVPVDSRGFKGWA